MVSKLQSHWFERRKKGDGVLDTGGFVNTKSNREKCAKGRAATS